MMFAGDEGRKVKDLSETLARDLNRRHSGDVLANANHNLQYGQYDEFVSNVYAAAMRRKIALNDSDKIRLDQLVSLMSLQQEIEELQEYIDTHPEPPTGLPAKRFG